MLVDIDLRWTWNHPQGILIKAQELGLIAPHRRSHL